MEVLELLLDGDEDDGILPFSKLKEKKIFSVFSFSGAKKKIFSSFSVVFSSSSHSRLHLFPSRFLVYISSFLRKKIQPERD